MRIVSAAEASRSLAELLDTVEAGGTVIVTRGSRPIAEIRPIARPMGRALRAALAGNPPPDDRFEADIDGAVARLGHR